MHNALNYKQHSQFLFTTHSTTITITTTIYNIIQQLYNYKTSKLLFMLNYAQLQHLLYSSHENIGWKKIVDRNSESLGWKVIELCSLYIYFLRYFSNFLKSKNDEKSWKTSIFPKIALNCPNGSRWPQKVGKRWLITKKYMSENLLRKCFRKQAEIFSLDIFHCCSSLSDWTQHHLDVIFPCQRHRNCVIKLNGCFAAVKFVLSPDQHGV